MAAAASNDIGEVLKPFFQRASEAEDRLARLEISVQATKDSGNADLLKKVAELQSQLENEKAERALEREKERLARLEISARSTEDTGNAELSKKVAELQSQLENEKAEREKYSKEVKQRDDEIAKHKYRIIHILRAVEEYKRKLSSK